MSHKKSYQQRLGEWEKARFSPKPPHDPVPSVPTFIEPVPMRDGIRLHTEIFLPTLAEKAKDKCLENNAFPVILIRSPYPYSCPSYNDSRPISRYLKAGYAVVFQLCRGQGQSEGVFHFMKDEQNDGYDCIEWIAKQNWSNSSVGMEGASYLGSTQLLAARAKPKALKCIIPTAFIGNFTQGFPFSYGVPNKGPFMQWYQLVDAEKWDDMDVAYCDMSASKLGSDESFYNRMIYEVLTDLSAAIKRDLQRYRRP